MTYKAILFDLDETLYPMGNPSIQMITNRMNEYIEKSLDIPVSDVKTFREDLYKTYGTTARGLVTEYDVNLYDFLRYVHGVDISIYMEPEPEVGQMIDQINLPKFVFTNADRFHAIRVLKLLEIYQSFDGIIDVLDVQPYCKPEPEAFEKAFMMIGLDNPSEAIFLDDNPDNVSAAHEMGIYAIQVGSRPRTKNADAILDRIQDFPQLDIFEKIVK